MNVDFERKIIALKGNVGKKWLNDLPKIIEKYEKEWNIKCLPPFPLSYNYVAPAKTLEGKSAILKISFPDNKEFVLEIQALSYFKGEAAIQILKVDSNKTAVLLEQAEPGERLSQISSRKKQIEVFSDVIKRLHKPITSYTDNNFPTIADWAKAFERYKDQFSINGPIPTWMITKAEKIFTRYINDKKETFLLHGDLHGDNILSSERGWIIIDPKGVIGEREFELTAFLRNPYYDLPKGSDYKKLVTELILQFSVELEFDKERILNWSFAGAVISLLWFLEDKKKLNEIYIQNAQLLNEIKLY